MKKRIILSVLALCSVFCMGAQDLFPYSFAPAEVDEKMVVVGNGQNEFVQVLICLDPVVDDAVARLKGQQIKGVRVYTRADYKQKTQKRSLVMACIGEPDNVTVTKTVNFLKGWNDVLFDEPVTIGDEKIFVGAQVFETAGVPYPFAGFSDASVAQGCWVNLNKTGWSSYKDRGTLYIAALLDADAARPLLARTVYLQECGHPQAVAPDADFEGNLYVHNFSDEVVSNVRMAMLGQGDATATERDVILSAPVPAHGSTVVTMPLHAGVQDGTEMDLSIRAITVNGQEAQKAMPGVTQLFVTADNFIRIPVIEEFTSQRCVNCPQMAYFLEKALDEYTGKFIYVAHHCGFSYDSFTTEPDKALQYIFGGYQNEYNPAIMYNRAVLDGEQTVVLGAKDNAAKPYLEDLKKAASMPASAAVEMELIEDATGVGCKVSGRVARDLIQKELYISVYLLEDSITVDNFPQQGLDDPNAPADLRDVFRHNGVIRHYYTSDAIGDLLAVNADGTYEITFSPAAINADAKKENCRLVVLVHRVNKEQLADNFILNAAQISLSGTVNSIQSVHTSAASDVLYDLQGRRVVNPRPGIYIQGGKKVIRK